MRKILLVLSLFMFTAGNSQYNGEYRIYFSAYAWTINDPNYGKLWLSAIKENWGATGVQLYAIWENIEHEPGNFDFTDRGGQGSFEAALTSIARADLDVNILVPMGIFMPPWADWNEEISDDGLRHPVDPNVKGLFSKQDFHIGYNGKHLFKGEAPLKYDISNRFFNLVSPKGIRAMENFYIAVLGYVKKRLTTPGDPLYERYKNNPNARPIEITPTINLVAEMELDSEMQMTGYSDLEITAFQVYLQGKYHNLRDLEAAWNVNAHTFPGFSYIDPRRYDWHTTDKQFEEYQYAVGRAEWLTFKFQRLQEVVNRFAHITRREGEDLFRMGVQIGSIHDFRLDFRGFYDPTSFLENAHSFRIADISSYRDYFGFGADYVRSIANYWDWKYGVTDPRERRGFSSETNWHLFGARRTDVLAPINLLYKIQATKLASDWAKQVSEYYDRGADVHVLFGWGNTQDLENFFKEGKYPTSPHVAANLLVANPAIIGKKNPNTGKWSGGWYREFIDTLSAKRNTPRKLVISDKAVHLSGDYFSSIPSRAESNLFYVARSIMVKRTPEVPVNYQFPERSYRENECEIITNYMIENSPEYLNRFNSFFLTESSEWMPEKVYQALLKPDIGTMMRSATYINSPEYGKFWKTPGEKNEFGKIRSPNLLIERLGN